MRAFVVVPLLVSVTLVGCLDDQDPTRSAPVFLLRGLDPFGAVGEPFDRDDVFIDALASWGWEADKLWTVGQFECDTGHRADAGDHGAPGLGHSGAAEPDDHRGDGCDSQGGHDRRTSLTHLAYHVAWTIESLRGDQCAKLITHSMAGIIAREALRQVEAGHPQFPDALCVDTVFTFGTPHWGSDLAWACLEQQCQQIRPGSDLLAELDAAGPTPQAGDTTWIAVGSAHDTLVTTPSQLAAGHIRVLYDSGLLDPFDAIVHDHYYDRLDDEKTSAQIEQGGAMAWHEIPFPPRLIDAVFSGRMEVLHAPSARGATGSPSIERVAPEPGTIEAATDVEVDCGDDPDRDHVHVVWRRDGRVVSIDRRLLGDPVVKTLSEGEWSATCQDAFGGPAVSWTVSA